MAEKYDRVKETLFSKRSEKQTGLEHGPQYLGGLFMQNHSRKEFSAGEFFWPFALSFLQWFSYSLQPANHHPPTTTTDQWPHWTRTPLTWNMCYWKQGSAGNLEFGLWGPNCQPILNFRGILQELAREILASKHFFI